MCEKTVKRRLARSMPLNMMQLAARMDEALDEQGAARGPHARARHRHRHADARTIPDADRADEISSDEVMEHDKALAAAAEKGTAELTSAWRKLPFAAQDALKAAAKRRYGPRAKEVDGTLT
jgi:hypothetical protein